jgi:hypothetical protein
VPYLLAFALAVCGAVLYARVPERASTWRDRDVRVDGLDEDWRGEELPVVGERFSLGVMNDGEWLYLCLPTKDPGTRTTMSTMGIVVWLNREGAKKQTFGIHFPVPNPPGARGMRRPPVQGGGEGQGREAPREGEGQQVAGQDEIGILGPGKNDARLVPIDQAGGIEARVGVHGDLMVYEVRIPLARSAEHPYSPDVRPGDTVRLRIETAPLRGGPIGPGSIGGVIVPGGWGVSVGRGGPGRSRVVQPIDMTMNVRLASGPPK